MSSIRPAHAGTSRTSANTGSRRQLQRLRREAGFRSAKEFAAELGVPESTYARYERATEGPGCGIPLSAAWAIADRLGESIDVVVGRESMDVPHVVTLDERAGALGPEGRRMLADFIDYLEAREGSGGGRR